MNIIQRISTCFRRNVNFYDPLKILHMHWQSENGRINKKNNGKNWKQPPLLTGVTLTPNIGTKMRRHSAHIWQRLHWFSCLPFTKYCWYQRRHFARFSLWTNTQIHFMNGFSSLFVRIAKQNGMICMFWALNEYVFGFFSTLLT